MKWANRDSLPIGFLVGAITPLIGIALVFFVFSFMESSGWIDESMGGLHSRRMRTVIIIGICTNLYWINKFNRAYTTDSLRGVTTATMLYAFAWFGLYYEDLYD